MDERKQQVLRAIVTLYTNDGEPIGSHLLSEYMDLAVSTSSMDEGLPDEPAWAMAAVSAMNENGIALTATQIMTRGEMAQLLYQISKMAQDAPGLQMYR